MSSRVKCFTTAVLATFALIACATPVAHAQLVGFYSFDNVIDPRNDDSGNGNDLGFGNNVGNPNYLSTGGFGGGGAYTFNSDIFVAPIDISPGTNSQMTIGAWVQTNTLTGLHKIIGSDNGGGDRTLGLDTRGNNFSGGFGDRYSAFTGSPGTAGGLVETPVGTFAPTGTGANDWSFVAVVYDQGASSATVYADIDASTTGDALVSFTKNPTATNSGSFATTAIGGLRPDNANEPWNGKIDNVFFFNTALTATQLTEIRDGTSALIPTGAANPEITLISPNVNDGSFESNTVNTGHISGSLVLPSGVWTLTETGTGGVLGASHNANFKSDGDDAIFTDSGTTSATSTSLLGGSYTAVSEGDIFEWAVDFTANGAGSEAEFFLDFGNGPVSLGTGLTDASSLTMESIFGTYTATAADAAGGSLFAIASITDSGPNAYLDNVRLGVTQAQVVPEPSALAIWGILGLVGFGAAARRSLKRRS